MPMQMTLTFLLQQTTPPQQIKTIVATMEKFKEFSGLAINVSKTKYALFGNAHNPPEITPQTKISLEDKPFRLLGIYFTGSLTDLNVNWTRAIANARMEIHDWNSINQTTTGRVNIAKACIMSKFTHIAAILRNPRK